MNEKNKPKRDKALKAAKIILALGEEHSASVLKYLDDKSIEAIAVEIAKINSLPPQERKEILKEFNDQINEIRKTSAGGLYTASQFLRQAFDSETAKERLEQIRNNLQSEDFSDFESYEPEHVATVLGDELPRTSAIVLTRFDPSFSAKILSKMDTKYRVDVAKQIAQSSKVAPNLLKTLHASLKKKLETVRTEKTETTGGEGALAEILRHMDRSSERNLIDVLSKDDPKMGKRLKDKLTVFTDILQLNPKETRRIVEKVPEKTTWAKALSGSGGEMIRHVLGALSVNRSSDISEEMQLMEDLSLKDIEKARREIIAAMEKADEAGEIVLRKDREELIE